MKLPDSPRGVLRLSAWIALVAASVLLCACSRSPQPTRIGPWMAGTNYTILSHRQATGAPPGTVQVVEFFWYGCPHCYALDPYLERWRMHKPAYVQFERVPVTWDDQHQAHARLFYALKTLGQLEALHSTIFEAVHQQTDPLYVPRNYVATLQDQERFVEAHGVDGAAFVQASESPAVDAELKRADDLIRQDRIDAVPTIIVDGRYETDVGMAGGDEQLIRLLGDLVMAEHRAAGS